MRTLRSCLLALTSSLLLLLAACAAGGSNARPGVPARVVYSQPSSGVSMVILNDAELVRMGIAGETIKERRLEFDSMARTSAGAKVATDEEMAVFIVQLEKNGFGKPLVQEGSGLTSDSSVVMIRHGDRERHISKASLDALAAEQGASARGTLTRKWVDVVLTVQQFFNVLDQAQAVDGAGGLNLLGEQGSSGAENR